MPAFLITYKPLTESRERGWPAKEVQRLAKLSQSGENPQENWRFASHKSVSIGDRAFLLQQGKCGPAIIGYGRVVGQPGVEAGHWRAPIQFDAIVDPETHILASKRELSEIEGAATLWRAQASGVRIPDEIAKKLEKLIVGRSPSVRAPEPNRGPDWTRDELVIALDFYLSHRPSPPRQASKEIRELSETISRLAAKLFSPELRSSKLRNPNGVYMKLMNFRRLDPTYTASGRKGLGRGADADAEVWAEFADNPKRCREVAQAIIAGIDAPEMGAIWSPPEFGEEIEEAPEGRLLTRLHLYRERDPRLTKSKKSQSQKRLGRLLCEACGFDFESVYGSRGAGFIECHHIKPVCEIVSGARTRVDDLVLLCANCHRMIHRTRPWLLISELKATIEASRKRPGNTAP